LKLRVLEAGGAGGRVVVLLRPDVRRHAPQPVLVDPVRSVAEPGQATDIHLRVVEADAEIVVAAGAVVAVFQL
jgi:hypothetical protein